MNQLQTAAALLLYYETLSYLINISELTFLFCKVVIIYPSFKECCEVLILAAHVLKLEGYRED